ncbi:MAG: hypothetical protein RIR98_1858, partial [Bacteroidota bacterium]
LPTTGLPSPSAKASSGNCSSMPFFVLTENAFSQALISKVSTAGSRAASVSRAPLFKSMGSLGDAMLVQGYVHYAIGIGAMVGVGDEVVLGFCWRVFPGDIGVEYGRVWCGVPRYNDVGDCCVVWVSGYRWFGQILSGNRRFHNGRFG